MWNVELGDFYGHASDVYVKVQWKSLYLTVELYTDITVTKKMKPNDDGNIHCVVFLA